MRILIIEDDKELCCLLNISLIQGGYETDICHTGSDGLFYAKQQADWTPEQMITWSSHLR